MKFTDDTDITGRLEILLFDANGNLKDHREIDNLVVTTGRNYIASRMAATPTAMSHMGIGSGAVAPALADTALGTQLARVALSSSTTATNVTSYSASFPAGTGTGAVTEAGIFNAASAGTMLNRATFAVVNKGADDTMQINWTVTIA